MEGRPVMVVVPLMGVVDAAMAEEAAAAAAAS